MPVEGPGGVKLYTPNNEKTILIAKCDVSGMNEQKANEHILSFDRYIRRQFNDDELNDDTLAIIVIPANHYDIEIYNPNSGDITREYIERVLEEYKEV